MVLLGFHRFLLFNLVMVSLYCFVLFCIIIASYVYLRSFRRLPLSPGPQGHFFRGVKHLLPTSEPWKTYATWADYFGDAVISFRVYNRRIIVLNSATAVRDLLEQRAAIYSDRPKSWMFHEICDRKKSVFNISSSDARHSQYRRLMHTGLSARATREYWPLLQSEAVKLLDGLFSSPDKYENHIRTNATAVIMKMAYGYSTGPDDLFVQVAEESSKISGWATAPGRWLVDYYPIVRFFPSWMPGARWKRQGEAWRKRLNILSSVPHEWVKQQMASGSYIESFTSRHLQPDGKTMVGSEQEDIIKWAAGGLYAGAADTTVSATLSFIHLMALYPQVQDKVQAELDAVVGHEHLPHPSDLDRLTYLSAVVREVLRFAPVANLALPHSVIQDDEYNGYRIPKDSTIVANVWAIMHDPELYPDPFTFSPDRFMAVDDTKSRSYHGCHPDPRTFAFGFGRRTCPGVHFAITSMMLNMASILSKFHFALPPGKLVRPEIRFTTGITSHIELFDIIITPRQCRDPMSEDS
ncbi:cytochrome P450 [Tricholoma matsutake]|nr:cytochrome P450 [Tricholoma matsutake 945]